jgi:uncharacterized protein YndB with AHSA1/START domain
MIITILIIAAGLAGLVIFVASRPAEFSIMRSGTFRAPVAAVFDRVNDLHQWQAWSPWARLDPAAENIFTGSLFGTGASMSWAGNKQVGAGRMTITETRPDSFIRLKLEFLKPFKAVNTAEFTFRPQDGQTVVTWAMSGTNHFLGKAIGLVMNCDKLVGGQFEQGLANLRVVVEAAVPK